MKVMIVEDEPLLREGLIRKIDWSQLDLQLAGEASDGLEAISQLEQYKPDIILTDVRMPGMDGLQFISKVHASLPHTKFVIISGYNEFEYVREAMQYNVKDYLLKPVDRDKLHTLLSSLCRQLRDEKQAAAEHSKLSKLEQLMRQSDLEAADFQFTHLLTEQGADFRRHLLTLGESTYWTAASIQITPQLNNARFKESDHALARFAVLNLIHDTPLSNKIKSVAFKHAYHPEEIVWFLGCRSLPELHQMAEELEETLVWSAEHLGLCVSIGIGSPKQEQSKLRISYLEARHHLKNRLLFGDGRVYADDCCGNARQGYPLLTEQAQKALSSMLVERNYKEFIQYAQRLFQDLANGPTPRYEQLEYLYTEIIHLLRRHTAKKGIHLSPEDELKTLVNLEDMKSWNDIIPILEQQLSMLDRKEDRSPSCDDIIHSVQQYVEQHFAENLSLQWVTDSYYIHPNYFSKRFKQVVGISFNDYVTRVRMERSKELLAATTMKIARISQLVGYEDQNYFCNVFKKATGISPSAYRGDTLLPSNEK
ncbi:response regulator [Paenibacillus solisilvae]|uniref:Response regulator n=1 Tax=Paenibacillus solisilvae TaxID=2486751 RepID=A0ABW0VVM0_9BACL